MENMFTLVTVEVIWQNILRVAIKIPSFHNKLVEDLNNMNFCAK